MSEDVQSIEPARARGTRGRIDSLTGLRAVAASGVFLTHITEQFFLQGPGSSFMLRFGSQGYTGVSFFYMLSGFVLTWSHRPGDTARAFYRRRFARVAPAYLTVLIAATVLQVRLSGQGARPFWEALPSFAALQAWVPDARVYFGGNAVGWSISCETFFYALFPALVLVLLRYPKHRGTTVAAVLALSVAPTLLLRPGDANSLALWASTILPPARLPEFVLGMLIAAAIRAGWRSPVTWRSAVVIAGAAYLLSGWAPYAHLVTLVPFALLIAAAAGRDLAGRSTPMSRYWPRRLGEWSFAFYLVHGLAIQVVRVVGSRFLDGLALSLVGSLLSLVLAFGSAIGLYFVVEAPFERRLRRSSPRPEMVERPL
jgi:peptidoglycan/LPS O-acetylase OafA/YrhL